MSAKRSIAIIGIFLLALLLVLPARSSADASPALGHAAQAPSCEQILARALSTLHQTCENLGRNTACYGNDNIQADLVLAPTALLKFNAAGDSAPIRAIKTLSTSPLDLESGTWGLSLLKLQANLPDTLPGQNVTFLVYGNTSIENTSGDMQSFYFTSGLGTVNCNAAPHDGIVVKSPNHTTVTFNANDVQITIASTIVLQAEPNKGMTVQLVEGHASVTTAQGTQTLKPGEEVNVPLGGKDGLQAAGAPSVPFVAPSDDGLTAVVTAAQLEANPDNGPALVGTANANGNGNGNGNGKSKGVTATANANAGGNGNGNNGNGNGNGGGNGSNAGGNGNGNNGNGNGNGGGNGSNAGGNGNGNNGNGNGNGGGNGSNGGGNGNGNNGNGNGNGGGNGSNGGGNGNGNNGNGNGNGGSNPVPQPSTNTTP